MTFNEKSAFHLKGRTHLKLNYSPQENPVCVCVCVCVLYAWYTLNIFFSKVLSGVTHIYMSRQCIYVLRFFLALSS